MMIGGNKYDQAMRLAYDSKSGWNAMQLTGLFLLSGAKRRRTVQRTYSELSHFIQRLPQHMIAYYMGLTLETISRVRKRNSTNK